MCRFNILDHFMLSQGLFDKSVESANTVHDDDNLSDHEPLFLVIQLVTDLITATKRVPNDKVAWHKANEDRLSAYQVALANNLAALSVPMTQFSVVMFFARTIVICVLLANTRRVSLLLI